MSGKAMRLKARIRNLAKQKDMSAQVILQNYIFERFLERLSKSEYCDKFILKGGSADCRGDRRLPGQYAEPVFRK